MECTIGCEKPSAQLGALRLRLVAHADELKLALKTLFDACHHIGNQSAHSAGHGIRGLAVVGGFENDFVAVFLDLDQIGYRLSHGAHGAPLTVISFAAMLISTLPGTLMGSLPTRDMVRSLHHDAQDFATNTGKARLAIGHDAFARWTRSPRPSRS